MERPRSPRWTILVAVGLLAAAVMLVEIALTRIFSFTIWHHFAFMVLSVALLGFAVSGVVLALAPQLREHPLGGAAWCAAGFAAAVLAAVGLVTHVPFDPTRLAVERAQLAYLVLTYAVLVVPFTLAGLAIVLLLTAFAASVHRLYASDLIGAGLGCMLVVALIGWLGADGVIWAAAAAAALAAALLRAEVERRGAARCLVLPLLAVVSLPLAPQVLAIRPGPGKGLSQFLDRERFPDARVVHTEWNAIARVDVVENSGTVRWTANPQAGVPLPPQVQIVIDGDAATPIVSPDSETAGQSFLDYMLPSAAAQVFRPRRALIIGAGGGVDVLVALRNGAEQVTAVEVNPAIAALMTGPYAARTGELFARPAVRLHVAEGRAFVRRTSDRFDVIQLSFVDTWAASASGAYSLAEAYLYTVEAFTDYLAHLTDDGVLTLTRWLWSPPRETLKLCTVAAAALRRLGVADPARHIVVLSLGRLGNVLVKRTPFTAADLAALQQVAAARQFGFLYAPGAAGENEFTSFLGAADPDAWIARYPYDVTPAVDDRPFFFQFGRWRDANPFGAGWGDSMLALSGRLVLLATLGQAVVLSALLLIAPLALQRRRGPRHRLGGVIVYFAAIGVSFMLLEVSLMQRLTLFLGHPVYATACVLAALLVAGGLGSACAGPLTRGGARLRLICAAIAALAIAYGALLPMVLAAALPYTLPARLAVAAGLLLPLGFLLGIPFPAAVASLTAQRAAPLIGWAWAANGCASVLGPLLAVLIAMEVGFAAVAWIAALGYGLALVAFGRWGGEPPDAAHS
ncbi:hypothetical protein KF840_20875 [bacterium]|nr:hypothetical protein [bacterium]